MRRGFDSLLALNRPTILGLWAFIIFAKLRISEDVSFPFFLDPQQANERKGSDAAAPDPEIHRFNYFAYLKQTIALGSKTRKVKDSVANSVSSLVSWDS